MNILLNFFQYINSVDSFVKVFLLILLIVYVFFALVLTFQIFSFNRLMEQSGFATIFRIIAILHAAISFILLLLTVFSL
ncbi:MAG: hypothetical protein Q7T54_04960 [Candidatus Levybacteria bacterium]|nr:hypothetical protein [Candidatus Levybacteria bacterium]